MSVEVYIVKPYRFRFLKMLGLLMVGLGILTFGYLGKTYLSLMQSAPRLSGEEVLGATVSVSSAESSHVGFGELFRLDTKADPAPKVEAKEIEKRSAVLGLKTREDKLASTAPAPDSKPNEFFISIPRLKIKNARVETEIDGTAENIYMKVLSRAVAHFKGTALPGEDGNVFLFGHSMLPIIASSSYESIFTNLPKLREGDLIEVKYGGESLTYRIRKTAVVDPKDVGVLKQPRDEKLLTIMTCIPPGFGSDRFVAVAELASGGLP